MNQRETDHIQERQDHKEIFDRAGVGHLFRRERENQGISLESVAEVTRIRPYILKAIEDENWDALPSSVFVQGFIQSYARILGLNPEQMAARYREIAPEQTTAFKTLRRPEARKGPWLALSVAALLLLAVVTAYGVWTALRVSDTEPPLETPHGQASKPAPAVSSTETSGLERPEPEPDSSASQPAVQEETVPPPEKSSSEETTEMPPDAPASVEDETAATESEAPPAPPLPPEGRVAAERPDGPASSSAVDSPEEEKPVQTSGEEKLVLEADVKERTWIRIFVDEQKAREYILRPGETARWEADKGFELLVGNAGGLELNFNGEDLGALGQPGQVVRVKFPETFERRQVRE